MYWAVILAGGAGTRFWPLSSARQPKHLLPLTGPVPTALATLRALEPLVPKDRVLVVAGAGLAPALAAALDLPAANLLIEPRPASTAPALVWAAVEAGRRDPRATILSLHADWWLGDGGGARFRAAAERALETAVALDLLVTTGMVPTRPETGYGYIVPGEPVAPGGEARRVARFQEKPDAAAAAALAAAGALWNSGLFAWTAPRLVAEVRAHAPEIAPALPALEAGAVNEFFETVRPISIDVGVLERSSRVAVLAGDFPWDDVGTWDALARVRPADAGGNVTHGPVHAIECGNTVVWSDAAPVVLYGVRDLIVVAANGRLLVLPRGRAGELKQVLETLPASVRDLP